jgi:hypothetical protein
LWVHIEATAGKENPLNARKKTSYAILALVEGDKNGSGSGRMKRGQIGRKRALVICGIAAGGLGDGDMDGHGKNSVLGNAGEGIGFFSVLTGRRYLKSLNGGTKLGSEFIQLLDRHSDSKNGFANVEGKLSGVEMVGVHWKEVTDAGKSHGDNGSLSADGKIGGAGEK